MLGSQRVGFKMEVEKVNQDWWRDKWWHTKYTNVYKFLYLSFGDSSFYVFTTNTQWGSSETKAFLVKTPLVPLPTNRGRWAPWIKKWRTIQPQIQQKHIWSDGFPLPLPPKKKRIHGFWMGSWTLLNKHSGNGIGLICPSRHSLTFLYEHTACHWKVRFPNIGILGRIPIHSVVE